MMKINVLLVLLVSLNLSGCASLLLTGAIAGASLAVGTATTAVSKTIDGVTAGVQGVTTAVDLLHAQPVEAP
ncbi:MAG: hypothetical protein AAFP10_00575 [Pseudomonadota bacterium]